MATLSRLETTGPSLRERAVEVTRGLQETGAITDDQAAENTADALLREVRAWLRQRAQTYTTVPLARAALRVAARDLGLPDEGGAKGD